MTVRGCFSCGVNRSEDRQRTYCSVVCRVPGQAGLGWRLNPYRIVDLDTGNVVRKGPSFDLTREGIAELQKKAEQLRHPVPEQATLTLMESGLTPMLPQRPPLARTFLRSHL